MNMMFVFVVSFRMLSEEMMALIPKTSISMTVNKYNKRARLVERLSKFHNGFCLLLCMLNQRKRMWIERRYECVQEVNTCVKLKRMFGAAQVGTLVIIG
jgi:hypothetical protein